MFCTYISHCTGAVVYIYTSHYCTHQPKTTNCNYLPSCCHRAASNKHTNQTPHTCHMCKLLNIHQLGKYANIYVKYELAAINDVARNNVQTQPKIVAYRSGTDRKTDTHRDDGLRLHMHNLSGVKSAKKYTQRYLSTYHSYLPLDISGVRKL